MTRLKDAFTEFENAVATLESSIESMRESTASAQKATADSPIMPDSVRSELSAIENKLNQAIAIIAELADDVDQSDEMAKSE